MHGRARVRLQRMETRQPVGAEHDRFAVKDCPVNRDGFDSFRGKLRKRQAVPVPADQTDMVAVFQKLRPPPIPLDFVRPVTVTKRRPVVGCKHRRDELRHG